MISGKIANMKIGTMLAYIGKHTMSIIMLHLLCFKLVSFIYIQVSGIDYLYLARFPAIKENVYLWIPYIVTGVAVPLIAEYIVKFVWKKRENFKRLARSDGSLIGEKT